MKIKPFKPFEPLLHRELCVYDVEANYLDQLKLLKSVTDYGTFLIAGTFTTSDKGLSEIIVISVLLKQVVSLLDSIHVLASNACTDSLLLQGRALSEASFYIDWILKSNTEEKCVFYYVSNLRKELQWLKRSIVGEKESEKFLKNIGDYSAALEKTRDLMAKDAKPRIKEIEKLLATKAYDKANNELKSLYMKRGHEVAWHSPLGPKSVRALAKEIERQGEYETFYAQASTKMHSSGYKSHVKFSSDQVTLLPIRSIDGLKMPLTFILSTTFHTYRAILERYRPGQLGEFRSKYKDIWRAPFLNIPSVKYTKSAKPTKL